MHRWEALVRFDPEIRATAEKLFPYGTQWIDELGRAFFALNEERSYLPGIVDQLIQDAERQRFKEKLEGARRFAETFSRTASGEQTSERAMAILVAAVRAGYTVDLVDKGAFSASLGEGVSFMYSNSDIERFGRFSKLEE